ncbi:MAG TPA: alternative ribosome rescue aminoacyl-tRNA hydrolase ArfB [Micromonosporaceae bacterium]|nr:alternative ribosome rescue aminoacyl-tRNA hydrolase ArfB [Micromonosporaceae bacterium]
MTTALPIRGNLAIPRTELRWRFSRSGGPGGQGVNTADSRVELLWDLANTDALPEPLKSRALERLGQRLVDGVLSVVVTEERAQLRNRQIAETRLARLVADAIAPPPPARHATRPSRASVERRLESKRRTSQIKRFRRPPTD